MKGRSSPNLLSLPSALYPPPPRGQMPPQLEMGDGFHTPSVAAGTKSEWGHLVPGTGSRPSLGVGHSGRRRGTEPLQCRPTGLLSTCLSSLAWS